MDYSIKNPNIGTWGCTFLKIPSGIFRLVTLPLEITKLSPLEILKNCGTPFGKSKVKNQDPWKFCKCFSLTNTCGNSTFLIDLCTLLGVALCLGLFWVLRWVHFQYFSLFLRKGLVCFQDILQRYSWYYFGNHTKKIIWHFDFVLQGYFKVF